MNMKIVAAAIFLVGLSLFGCKQESVVWPDSGSSTGVCGADYPAGPYSIEEGSIIECYSWNANVRKGEYANPETESLDLALLKSQYDAGEFDAIREQFGFSNASVDPEFLVFVSIAKL